MNDEIEGDETFSLSLSLSLSLFLAVDFGFPLHFSRRQRWRRLGKKERHAIGSFGTASYRVLSRQCDAVAFPRRRRRKQKVTLKWQTFRPTEVDDDAEPGDDDISVTEIRTFSAVIYRWSLQLGISSYPSYCRDDWPIVGPPVLLLVEMVKFFSKIWVFRVSSYLREWRSTISISLYIFSWFH